MNDVLVEMMHDGFVLSSRLIECSMPAYRSLIVTSQMLSASKAGLLEELFPPAPGNERLSLLGTMARSAEQGCEGSHSLGREAGLTGPPGLLPDTQPRLPGGKHTQGKVPLFKTVISETTELKGGG